MTVIRALGAVFLAVLGAAGCVSSEGSEGGIGLRVTHLTGRGPAAGLPDEADTLRFVLMSGNEVLRNFNLSVVGLEDIDGDGDPEAVIGIPPDTDLSLTVFASKNINALASARIDGLRVPNGGRRYVDITFTPVRAVSTLPSVLPSGRFGHAGALTGDDGRVLLTGGFTAASVTTCPAELASAEICFRLEATDQAFLVDPPSGAIHPTQVPMLARRALHTATALPDGRVLIAGGVDAAVLGLERIESGDGARVEYRPSVVPVSRDGFEGAHRTFELFDPSLLREEEDLGRDGDPRAGAFVGAPGEPSTPGGMNTARFLHAAAPLPGVPSPGVLVVGGQGAPDAPHTGEVFLARRAGGSGFDYPPPAFVDTGLPRVWPAAASSEEAVFVMGGAWEPRSAVQIGETFALAEGSDAGAFQSLASCPGWSPADRPNNALVGAAAVVFGRAERRVLVAGWMGPLCTDGSVNLESWEGFEPCAASTYAGRAFTVGTTDCSFGRLQEPGEHWLGGVAALPNGGAILAGGFSNGVLDVTNRLELFTGEFNPSTWLAMRNTGVDLRLGRSRAWLTATSMLGGRVLLAGGMSFTFDGTGLRVTGLELSSILEVYDPGHDPSEGS